VRADPGTPAGRIELGDVASEVTDLVEAFPAYPRRVADSVMA
jgi:hypothetical protein